MSCPSCAQRGVDHDDVVRRCLASPLYVGMYLCGFDKFNSDFHHAVDEWHMKKLSEGKKRFLVMVARDHLKTSYWGIATPIWYALRSPEQRILYVMASSTESSKTLQTIERICESDAFKHFFPKRAHNRAIHKSTKDFMNLPRAGNYREHTMEARGVDSTVTGGHFTTQIFDDLIDSTIENSDVEQEKVIRFFRDATNMFVNMDKDVRYVVGTRWGGMFYDWLLDESNISDLYEKLVVGCEIDERYRDFLSEMGKTTLQADGEPIWHEHFTRDMFEEIEIEEGPVIFNRQFRNMPTLDEDRRFSKEEFRSYYIQDDNCVVLRGNGMPVKIPIKRLFRTMTIDPATGEHKKTDDSVISVAGYDNETGLIFILDEYAGKVKPDALIDIICRKVEQWKPQIVAPEDASYQVVFKNSLRTALIERGLATSIRPAKHGSRSKLSRIEGLQPFVANGQVCIKKDQHKLLKELCGLQIIRGKLVGRSPNRADALAYHADFWSRARMPDVEAEDDIPLWDPIFGDKTGGRSYGLECTT